MSPIVRLKSWLAACSAAVVVSAMLAAPAQAGDGISVRGYVTALQAVPNTSCQTRVLFNFSLYGPAGQETHARYVIKRSDGSTSRSLSATLYGNLTSLQLSAWIVNGAMTGWEQLVVMFPTPQVASAQIPFTTRCSIIGKYNGPPLNLHPLTIGPVSVSPSANARPQCPATYRFTSSIAAPAGHPLTSAQYMWQRSDGTTGPVQTVALTGTTPVTISDSWHVTHSVLNGWERVETQTPYIGTSTFGNFRIQCHARAAQE